MKKILYLIPLFLLVSCSVSRNAITYTGKIQFFLPNGDTKEYDADYTKTYETKGKKTRVNENFNLHIGDQVVVAKDIPSFFIGKPADPGAPIDYKIIVLKTNDGDQPLRISRSDFFSMVDQAAENKDKLLESLSDYLFKLTGTRYAKEEIVIPVDDFYEGF